MSNLPVPNGRGGRARCAATVLVLVSVVAGCRKHSDPVLILPPKHTTSVIQLKPVEIEAIEAIRVSTGSEAGELTMLEIIGCGVGCLDYDLDGRCDLYFPCGGDIEVAGDSPEDKQILGRPSHLVRNLGDDQVVDVSSQCRAEAERLFAHGVTSSDFDHDGMPDLLVYGYHGVVLYRNMGDGTFNDVTDAAGMTGIPWTTSVAWLDANHDGYLDLYGAAYVNWSFQNHPKCEGWWGGELDVCPPLKFAPSPDWFYFGNPDGTFRRDDANFEQAEEGRGLGVMAFRPSPDDQRGRVYVANDMSSNALFIETEEANYSDDAVLVGAAVDSQGVPNASMGIALLDADRNAQFDLFVTNFDHEYMALYAGEGDVYEYRTFQYGLTREVPPSVAFGVVAADFDLDTDEDVFFVCGGVEYAPAIGTMDQVPILLENVDAKRFARMTPNPRFHEKEIARGCASLDWNNDGLPDLVTSSISRSPTLYRNESDVAAGQSGGNWLRVRLVGTESPRSGLGAVVAADIGEKTPLVRQVYGGGSYLSQSQSDLFLGLGDAVSVDLKVSWPNGNIQHVTGITANQVLTVVESTGP